MEDQKDNSFDFNGVEQMEREEKEKLEKKDIDKAMNLISERYPLNNMGITDVFTILRPLLFWRKISETKKESKKYRKCVISEAITKASHRKRILSLEGLQTKVLTSQNIIIKDSKKNQEDKMSYDPFNLLGIGIVAQFNLMLYLIMAFVLFSLLAIPMINIYSGYDAMEGTKKESYTSSTLGNFGFSSSA
jgi:hypothetical protein